METSQDKKVSEAARLLSKRGCVKGRKGKRGGRRLDARRKAVTARGAQQKAMTEEAQDHDQLASDAFLGP